MPDGLNSVGWGSIAVSVVVHAAAVGALAWRAVGQKVDRGRIEIEVRPAAVMVVADGSDARPAPAEEEVASAVSSRRVSDPSAKKGPPKGGPVPRPEPRNEPPRSSLMRMRPVGPQEDESSAARVPMPFGMPKDFGPAPPDNPLAGSPLPRIPMQSTHEDHLGGAVGDGDGGYRKERQTFVAKTDRDGTIHFNDKPNVAVDRFGVIGGLLPGLMGHFDVTDALMRAHGDDPYRYEKYKYMEQTRDERAKMAVAAREERLREAVHRMPTYLGKVWGHTKWTEPQRRRLLFELWDEVVEEGDDALVNVGLEVRAQILGFIRVRLPAGGPQAYTDGELRALNGIRKSRARFDPYR